MPQLSGGQLHPDGANIDYAIVIADRYVELKQTISLKDAVIESLNEAFPTIITSGTILASAGVAIGLLSTTASIASIGVCLGRGTLISIFLVMGILPQILLLGDTIIEKTAFPLKARLPIQAHTGALRVEGHARGCISGMVDADFSDALHSGIDAAVAAGAVQLVSAVDEAASDLTDIPVDGLDPMLQDTSEEDIAATRDGKVADCRNTGAVGGDRNVGGVIGAMAIEFDLDPEDDATGVFSFGTTYETKAVLQGCVDHGSVTAKRTVWAAWRAGWIWALLWTARITVQWRVPTETMLEAEYASWVTLVASAEQSGKLSPALAEGRDWACPC